MTVRTEVDVEPPSTLGRRWYVSTVALTVVAATAMLLVDHGRSWHYFSEAADLFRQGGDGGGFALYRAHPEFQFGPPAVAFAALVGWMPAQLELWAVMVSGSLVGVYVLRTILRRSTLPPTVMGTMGVAAITTGFMVVWLRLAAYSTHLDDVAALGLAIGAGAAIDRRRPTVAAVLVGLAAGFKPWAIVFAPMVLVASSGRRRIARLVIVASVAVIPWVPFLLESGTLDALRSFRIGVDANSGLRAMALLDATTPMWLRPTQLLLAGGLALLAAVRARRWPAVLLAGIVGRLLIDPATHHYYSAGLAVAGLAWELDRWPDRFPWHTAAAVTVAELAAFDVTLAGFMAYLRAAVLVAMIAAAVSRPLGREVASTGRDVDPLPSTGGLVAAFSGASDSRS